MLTYSLSDIGEESLYVHLYKCLKNDILEGNLLAKSRLPSKRNFAKNLGVSVITVENAYELLQSEGYIYSVPKSGFFVSEISVAPKVTVLVKQKKEPVSLESKKYVANFSSSTTISEKFPFSIWAKLTREIISAKSDELMIPSPSGGVLELRSAICVYLKQFRNMAVEPEQIVIGAGTDYLYNLLIQLLGQEKLYAIEDPGYSKIAKVYDSNRIQYQHIALDKSGVVVEELEQTNAEILHISPTHHYPTGIVTPISRRYELLGWASKEENRYIIEDDYDSEFRLTGKPIPTLSSIDAVGKVIYMNTFTKTLSPTIRISYMILPQSLLHQFYEQLGFYSCTVSNFEQYILAKFIGEGYFEKHINRMRSYYRSIRDQLLLAIEESPLHEIVNIYEEEAGLHFLMKVNTKLSDAEITRRAKDKQINISCLSKYYAKESPDEAQHTLVINYSGMKNEDISDAVQELVNLFISTQRKTNLVAF